MLEGTSEFVQGRCLGFLLQEEEEILTHRKV